MPYRLDLRADAVPSDHPSRELKDHANLDRPGPKVHPKVAARPSDRPGAVRTSGSERSH